MHFFTEKLIYKSNRKLFSCATWPDHSIKSGRILKLCKPLTSSRVCITHVYIRQCKHRKHFLLLKYFQVWNTFMSFEEFYLWTSCHQYVFFLTHLLQFSPSICYRPFPLFYFNYFIIPSIFYITCKGTSLWSSFWKYLSTAWI